MLLEVPKAGRVLVLPGLRLYVDLLLRLFALSMVLLAVAVLESDGFLTSVSVGSACEE